MRTFFFSSRRRHTRQESVSWARRCVQETGYQRRVHGFEEHTNKDETVEVAKGHEVFAAVQFSLNKNDEDTVHLEKSIQLYTAVCGTKSSALIGGYYKMTELKDRRLGRGTSKY
eukprot:TRINITY_DN11169_c0_g1_i2.p1 TRINITY_DN11169_c0_g1~~TRINITY_DN11169_c0_g1_i2.p1  ORF type:complete len:114 (+),score=51.11 TRINITY_DN11169_c0_g1_i2:70-411(+)